MTEDQWAPEWQRGVLATCALAVLARGPAHGYAVAQQLGAAGIGPVKGGALYPVLNRLEQDGSLASTWQEGQGGPGRKVFNLTERGTARLAAMREGWSPFAAAVSVVLSPPTSSPTSPLTSPSTGPRAAVAHPRSAT